MDKRWINLVTGDPHALTAVDIPYDTSSNSQTLNQIVSNGSKSITSYTYSEDATVYTTSSESWVSGLSLVIPPSTGHNYRVSWYYSFRTEKGSCRILLTPSNIILDESTFDEDEYWRAYSGFKKLLSTGDTIEIQYKSNDDDEDVKIKDMRLEFWELD